MNSHLDRIAPGRRTFVMFCTDLLWVVFAVCLTSAIVEASGWYVTTVASAAGVLAWIIAATILRLYNPWTPRGVLDSVLLRGVAVVGVVGTVWLVFAATATALPDLPLMGAAIFFGGGLTREIVRRRVTEMLTDPVLIVGVGPLARSTYEHLSSGASPRDVIGFLRFGNEANVVGDLDVPILGSIEDLDRVLCEHPVNEVYAAGSLQKDAQRIQSVVASCERVGMPFALPMHGLELKRATLRSSLQSNDGYLHYLNTPPRPVQLLLKRLIDVVASLVALIVLSPLLLLTALAIKISSPGPVLFRQQRVGLHGAHFSFFKFRSMVVDAEALKEKLQALNEQTGPVFKMENDPRVTRVGRFIRKFSIDELPQLVNILRGDMSIVGPRPPLPKEVAQYKGWQRRRLSVRPGLTCFWQVAGRNEIGFTEWMELDMQYVDTWHLGVDIYLILKTVPVVLAGRGAS